MTEKEKMLSGLEYNAGDEELTELRLRSERLCQEFNRSDPGDAERRASLLRELMPGSSPSAYLRGPIRFDYGCFTELGENSGANFNFTCLDCAPVKIGKNVLMGPNVSLLTPLHPMDAAARRPFLLPDGTLADREYARPITIGDNCWLGGSVTVCGGVTIGAGTVIGAGSVVTRDIPAGVLAAGNPCRVIRTLEDGGEAE